MDPMPTQSLDAALRALAERARLDPAFHARCRRAPALALREATGISLPAGLTLRFLETGPGECVVPLPPLLGPGLAGELSNSDLEAVAGGTAATFAVFSNTVCAVGIAALVVATVTLTLVDHFS